MKPSERNTYHRLAQELVTPKRFDPEYKGALAVREMIERSEQPTVEFDSREVIDALWDADIEAEKARILALREAEPFYTAPPEGLTPFYATEQPEPPEDIVA